MKEPTRYKKIIKVDPNTGQKVEHIIAVDKPRGVKTIDWAPEWELKLIKLASKGATWQELASSLRISHYQFKNLIKRDEYFAEVIEECKDRAEAWWLKQGRVHLRTKEFQGALYYANMKNRYGWRDRTDLTSKGDKLPQPILAIQNVVNENEVKEIENEEKKELEGSKKELEDGNTDV